MRKSRRFSTARTVEARGAAGFTLIEILISVTLMTIAVGMICVVFGTVTASWRRSSAAAEDLHHGDFVLDQLCSGLRSAYFPDTGGQVKDYGFWLEDGGSGEAARDSISWVKQGPALSEGGSAAPAGPHRVRFSVEDDGDGNSGAAVRFWRPYSMPADFDPGKIPPRIISRRVVGFDCRVATNMNDGNWEWQDVWEKDDTDRLPPAVELTVYLSPLEEGRPPFEMKRYVEIPVWELSKK